MNDTMNGGMDQTLNPGSALEETSLNKGVSSHELKTSNHVYLLDPVDSWIPCQVVERRSSTEAVVSIPQYRNQQSIKCDGGRSALRKNNKHIDLTKYSNQALPLQNVDEDGRLKQVEDMVDLPYLHEVSGLGIFFLPPPPNLAYSVYTTGGHSLQHERAAYSVTTIYQNWRYCACV